MNREDLVREMRLLQRQESDLREKITDAARPLIPVLLDAGRPNSAKELQELFFEMDLLMETIGGFIKTNGPAVIAVISENIKRGEK